MKTRRRLPDGPSALEQQLKQIVRDHPRVAIHPHSPTGPYVRAVMWTAQVGIFGQAFQETDGTWTVRAFVVFVGEDSLVVDHPADMASIPASIDTVLAALADRF